MHARTPSDSATAAGTGLLLLACGAATATAALVPTLPGARIVAGSLVAAAAVVAVLGAPGVRRRPVVQAVLAGFGLGVAGQVFSSVGSDAPAVVPVAGAAVLLWSALAPSARATRCSSPSPVRPASSGCSPWAVAAARSTG